VIGCESKKFSFFVPSQEQNIFGELDIIETMTHKDQKYLNATLVRTETPLAVVIKAFGHGAPHLPITAS